MREEDVFSSAFLQQSPLVNRLIESLREAKQEFGESPGQYIASAIRGEGIGGHLRIDRLRFGLALALATYLIVLGLAMVLSSFGKPHSRPIKDFLVTKILPSIPPGIGHIPDSPAAGDQDKAASGGGGGGRGELREASIGQPPPSLPSDPIIAPTTKPEIESPSLPIPETLLGPPEPRTDAPTGLREGVAGPPSDGPGSNRGVGPGDGGGAGSGRGPGSGPGEDGGNGGGEFNPGGRRHSSYAGPLSSKPIPLNHPRPNYTEEARKQRVQGVVKARVLVGTDGNVKSVRILSGLSDGLDEEAIRAAYEMRFRAATSSGHPIETWVTLEIEFN